MKGPTSKIKVPADIHIRSTIRIGSVYYFEEEQLSSPEPHYFVVLNKDPHTAELLLLVCASSQVEKRKNAAKKLGFPEGTLVCISPAEYPLFTKESVIDCNRVIEKTIQSLIEKLEQGKLGPCTEIMPKPIIQKLIAGVVASDQVSENIKKLLV